MPPREVDPTPTSPAAPEDDEEEEDDHDDVDLGIDYSDLPPPAAPGADSDAESADDEDLPDMVSGGRTDDDDDADTAAEIVTVSSTSRKRRASDSAVDAPSHKKSKASDPPALPSTPVKKNGKKRYGMFTPRTQNTIRKGKEEARYHTFIVNAYPDPKRKVEHYEQMLEHLVEHPDRGNDEMRDVLLRLRQDPDLLESATIMMSYGRGDLNLAIISFARGAVQKFDLGHQGGQSETKTVVIWLKEVFMYGGLNVQKRTYDKNLKFQPTWIIDFMRWFLFMCNGKMDGVTFHAIMKLQAFPPRDLCLPPHSYAPCHLRLG
ncbi:hypothetical protein CYLTODRAFT_213536 [Cylindrobasidium torrendii FP15055 ss-10]|uniref:DUF6532 domain-containing protein n=1 Tax=Cylindrobasidium torrendii FP15055 ss-10 TaxID=1314674 RepID=A0A0D7AU60_9AGAR|nr:hypothetical protein CYLTODRAFT_213536 [Cylindrobasidium torrendii FP15055 ss-10]